MIRLALVLALVGCVDGVPVGPDWRRCADVEIYMSQDTTEAATVKPDSVVHNKCES